MYIMIWQAVGTKPSITLYGPFDTSEDAIEFGQAWSNANTLSSWLLFDKRPDVTWFDRKR